MRDNRIFFWVFLVFWIISVVYPSIYLISNPIEPICNYDIPLNSLQNPCDFSNTGVEKTIMVFWLFSTFFSWIILVKIKGKKS